MGAIVEQMSGVAVTGDNLWAVGSGRDTRYSPRFGYPVIVRHSNAACNGAAATPTPGGATPLAPPLPVPGNGSVTFLQTGKKVTGIFLSYWNAKGGVPRLGYPVSEVLGEVSALDGKLYTMQYFERAVLEYHPEHAAPYNVLLSQLGTFQYGRMYPGGAPGQAPNTQTGSALFPETSKMLGGKFLQNWQGIAQNGYPISNELMEVSPIDGRTYIVQYFERAVIELHPENKQPYDVLPSLLGTMQYKEKYGKLR